MLRKKHKLNLKGCSQKHVETTTVTFVKVPSCLFQWFAYWIDLKHRDFLLSALKPKQVTGFYDGSYTKKNGLFVCVTSIWRVKPKPKAAWWFQPLWKISVNGKDYPIYYGQKNMFQATNQKVFITANRTAIKKFLLPEASTCSPSWLVESPIIMLGSMAQNVGKI